MVDVLASKGRSVNCRGIHVDVVESGGTNPDPLASSASVADRAKPPGALAITRATPSMFFGNAFDL